MEIIRKFTNGISLDAFRRLMDILTLGPDSLPQAFAALAVVFLVMELLKCYLMIERTRSVIVHVCINLLSLLPAFLITAVLLYAGYSRPERAWTNLLFGVSLFVPWYLAGMSPRLSRHDVEGADLGFMAVGFLMVVPAGFAAVLIF